MLCETWSQALVADRLSRDQAKSAVRAAEGITRLADVRHRRRESQP
jgi:hypothetical protein